jgi:hypothetical protein
MLLSEYTMNQTCVVVALYCFQGSIADELASLATLHETLYISGGLCTCKDGSQQTAMCTFNFASPSTCWQRSTDETKDATILYEKQAKAKRGFKVEGSGEPVLGNRVSAVAGNCQKTISCNFCKKQKTLTCARNASSDLQHKIFSSIYPQVNFHTGNIC